MNHWKDERVTYRVGIRNFRTFGLAETRKSSFYPAAVLSRTDSSSVTDAQNYVISKPLVR
jgi:hypothetical protein